MKCTATISIETPTTTTKDCKYVEEEEEVEEDDDSDDDHKEDDDDVFKLHSLASNSNPASDQLMATVCRHRIAGI